MSDLVWHTHRYTIPSALALLPGIMDSREARAMMLAIGLQESEFAHRKQIGGPAKGFWQFERNGGVAEILESVDTKNLILPICKLFLYSPTRAVCHAALEHHDVLAACFARLLLWRDPQALPSPIEVQKGWQIYRRNWRPGKPHPEKWPVNFREGWRIVKGE